MKNSLDILSTSDKTKAMWDIVKNTTTSSRYLVENVILKDNGRIIKGTNNPEKVANLFNKHFSIIASDLTKGLKPKNSTSYASQKISDTMFISETSPNEILRIVSKLKNKYSSGLDEFPDCLLKTCAPDFIHPLTHIFSASLRTVIFPNIFKTAKIKPLFKKGTKMIFKITGQFLFCQFSQKY